MHKVKTHASTSVVCSCINTVYCPLCMLLCHTRAAVMAHMLDKSQICRVNLLLAVPWLSQEVVAALNGEATLDRNGNMKGCLRKSFHEVPVVT